MSIVWDEVERLHALGFALLYLHPKSKRPIGKGWSEGPRASLEELKHRFQPELNLGVRLGTPSQLGERYLAVIDVDIKSQDQRHLKEATAELFRRFPVAKTAPKVLSGRGNGSSHYYVLTEKPIGSLPFKFKSGETVKVLMPSVPPNKTEIKELSEAELLQGYRLRRAFEMELLGEGKQVVLPPSIHPDSRKPYLWDKKIGSAEDIPFLDLGELPDLPKKQDAAEHGVLEEFSFVEVDVKKLPLSPEQIEEIVEGEGVEDRSATIFKLSLHLLKNNVSDNQILSLFTDRRYYLGQTGYDHRKTNKRGSAAEWLYKHTLLKAKKLVEEDGEPLFDFDTVAEFHSSQSEKNTAGERQGSEQKLAQVTSLIKDKIPGLATPLKSWEYELELYKNSKKQLRVRAHYQNITTICENIDPKNGFLAKNDFSGRHFYLCDTPWGNKKGTNRTRQEDEETFKHWFVKKYKTEPTISKVTEIFNALANQHSFHPVRDYLNSLTWDGVPRMKNVFRTYYKSSSPDPYLTQVCTKFFVGAVKRIFEPGCQFDYLVVLQGKQGVGKSSSIKILATKEDWYLGNMPRLDHKDAMVVILGKWFCELEEFNRLLEGEGEVAKSFISRSVDTLRKPYGAEAVDCPRQCMLVATVNPEHFLKDPTGNRRYWVVKCDLPIDLEGLSRDVHQIWAEAVHTYRNSKPKLYLEGEAAHQALKLQGLAEEQDMSDVMHEMLVSWIALKTAQDRAAPDGLRLSELFQTAWANLREDNKSIKMAGIALKKAGFERKRSTAGRHVWLRCLE